MQILRLTTLAGFLTVCTLLFVIHDTLEAQNRRGGRGSGGTPQGSVSGRVVDSTSGGGVLSASVALWRLRDSTLAAGVYTEADGSFALEGLRPGRYYLRLSSVGYQSRTIPDIRLQRGARTVGLGDLLLQPGDVEMDEVEVRRERHFVEMGIDRTSYNVGDQLVSTGGSASDVLENIPSVEVDIDGNVSLRGNQNVAIQINGRPAPVRGDAVAGFLQSFPADMIDRVEVIPNPSAKYEPDGMAGILNLVLKKDSRAGMNGTLNLGLGSNNNVNASGSLNFRDGPFHLFANYGFRYNERDAESDRFKENRFQEPLTFLDQVETEERLSRSHSFSGSLDYALDKQNSLSFTSFLNFRPRDEIEDNTYSDLDAERVLTGSYTRISDAGEDELSQDYSLAYRNTIEASKHEFTAEARFNTETEEERGEFREFDLDPESGLPSGVRELQNNTTDETEYEADIQADYLRPLFGDGKLETGIRSTFRRLDNAFYSETFDTTSGAFLPDTDLNNSFVYDEHIYAAYAIYGQKFGDLSLQAGVRLEQALTNFSLETAGEEFSNDYFSVFPNAYLAYALDDTRNLKLSYSKRIRRPRTRQLNPFNSFDDPLNRRVGNPFLQPEFTHAVELSFQQFTEETSLSLSPYFRHTTDIIRRLLTVDEEGVSTQTFENFNTSDSYGVELIGTWQIRGVLNAYASVNLYRVVSNTDNIDSDLANDAFAWSTRINATYTVLDGLSLQLSWFYRAPRDIEGGRIDAFTSLNLALKQELFNERASISLNVRDVFDSMEFQLWREDDNFYQETRRKRESQIARLTFSYIFGVQERNNQRRRRDGGGGGDDLNDVEF